jgi:hypothetical protein
MKNKKYLLPILIFNLSFLFTCQKNSIDTSSLYAPSTANVTANATLAELQEGRILYIENCNRCHGLYSPDNFSVTQWKSVLNSMAQKTSMSASDIQLVTKYVCKGKQ